MTQQVQERTVTLEDEPVTLVGRMPCIGDAAPDFLAVAGNLSTVAFSSFRGEPVVLSSVVSVDTDVCRAQTLRFNEEAGQLGPDVQILTISMDLPFALERWRREEGVEDVITLSDHRDAAFGTNYGLLMKDLRLLARAVLVVDREGVIRHKQIVPEVTDEPDYEAALAAVKDWV
jgi:thiol peroxidase